MYKDGIGTTHNYKKAIHWFTEASMNGDTKSQYYLGYTYEMGDGIEINYEKALYFYRMAAEKGGSTSQYQKSRYKTTYRDDSRGSMTLSCENHEKYLKIMFK